MIDLHCHILPNIDDGSKGIAESIELILNAKKLGYKTLCCTPHYKAGRYENKGYEEIFEHLKSKLEDKKIEMELLTGNELFLDPEGMRALKNKEVKTIGGSNYLLAEAVPGMTFFSLRNSLEQIIKFGYRPILAHVERYPFIDIKTLYELKKLGVIIQVNLGSLKHKKEIYRWIDLKLVDIMASDAHDTRYRNYDLQEMIRQLESSFGAETRERLLEENPRKIIENKGVGEIIDEKKIMDNTDIGGTKFKCFFKRFRFGRSTKNSGRGKPEYQKGTDHLRYKEIGGEKKQKSISACGISEYR